MQKLIMSLWMKTKKQKSKDGKRKEQDGGLNCTPKKPYLKKKDHGGLWMITITKKIQNKEIFKDCYASMQV